MLCHAVTYATSSTVLPVGAGGEGAGRAARPAADRRRSTTRTPTPASGWPTARPAACRRSRARSRARGIPYDTVAGTIDDDERAWAKIGALGARGRRRARAAAARGSASSGTSIRACSTCTPTSPPCTRRSARTSRCSRSTTSARAWRRRPTTEVARQAGGDPRDVRLRRPVGRPDRRADRGRAARLVGARRRRPRPARGRLRARRADLLLPRRSTATRPSGSAPA